MRTIQTFHRIAYAAALTTIAMEPAIGASDVSISQVYGGGGNSGAVLTNDFIELHNRSAGPVDVSGWSVQYASAAGTTWQRTLLSGIIPAGGYYLVQEAQGTGGTQSLPTPDATGTIAMSATAGKVALSASGTLLTGSCPSGAADLFGFGTANCFEGAVFPALTNPTAALRAGAGCTDTDNNAADFASGAPAPRNAASASVACGADAAPRVSGMSPAAGSGGGSPGTHIVLTFNEPVTVSGAWFGLSGSVSGNHTATVTGGPVSFTLDPGADFLIGETVTVTVSAALVSDVDADDPPDHPVADFTGAFSIAAPVRIHALQGAGHLSPLSGQSVAGVEGVVTAVLPNGFFLQDTLPDADPATSEAIFVFTNAAPTVHVGDVLSVDGRVSEFRPGGATTDNLTTTELTAPAISLLSSGHALPDPVLIGLGGRVPPDHVIEDDAPSGNVETSGAFDPDSDGIDFYESLEGMRVQVSRPVVIGPRNSFGEFLVLGDSGSQASLRTPRGGLKVRARDFNPEKIMVDDALTPTPPVNVGDAFAGPIVGVLDYQFANFKILPATLPARIPGPLAPEVSSAGCSGMLSVATFNVENLDPSDPQSKFDQLAGIIVHNLASPLLIGLEEVQDNNGAVNDGTVDASLTASRLIAAIQAAGGPAYQYRDIAPQNLQDGGEPGGNIRVAFLYQAAQGLAFVSRPGGTAVNSVAPVATPAGVKLNFSPGRINPTHPAFNNSRKPLVGEFTFKGRTFFVIANHFNSKGGDQPLFGRFQPPVPGSEDQRLQQAQQVQAFAQSLLAQDPNARLVLLGDFNDFEFSNPLAALKGSNLVDLMESLPENERYSYVYEGNSQALDHILVSRNLANQPATFYDVVHVNSEFAEQASDHEPQRACFDKGRTSDAGLYAEELIQAASHPLFGVSAPLEAGVPAVPELFRTPAQSASDQVALAPGLTATYLTRSIANNADQFAFWPDAVNPTHAIFCIEGDREAIGTFPNTLPKYNPSVQRVDRNGHVETILRGMTSCDGIVATPWGTILATEEEDDGGAYEILDPLATTDYTVLDRATGDIIDVDGFPGSARIAKRTALPVMAWEGLAVLPSGIVYAGDELRPGTDTADADGGAIAKFIPAVPAVPGVRIASLSQSPLVSGSVHVLQVSCVDNARQSGQGCEVGNAAWVPVDARMLRREADGKGATGFYRPEDMHRDPAYSDSLHPNAVRFCWTNTQNEKAKSYAEVLCAVDNAPDSASPAQRTAAVSRFITGDKDFNSFDNLAFQPGTGNLYVVEDHDNGDVFACLADGADRDRKTDGCIKVLSVKDTKAEPTGFAFTADGKSALLSIQHSNDGSMPLVDDYATDDILLITGFQSLPASVDAGAYLEQQLAANTRSVFGLAGALNASAPASPAQYRTVFQSASDQVALAPGLSAAYLTRKAANAADMFAFWPDASNPTHAIFCIEGGRQVIGTFPNSLAKYNPSVQRVDKNGNVETILRGMSSCDGISLTPWGTLLATEETSDGGAYEILNPLGTTDFTVQDRATGGIIDANGNPETARIAKRAALPVIAWEGLEILPSGILYAGDELRPGTGAADADGGAIYKFVPSVPATGAGPISTLSQSPLVSGSAYAMQVSCLDDAQQFGQGCEVGNAAWIPVPAATARAEADARGATGFYRPEDLERDPVYADTVHPAAVRFCWTNTQSESAGSFGEVLCAVDENPALASSTQRTVTVSRFLEGDRDFNSFDNLAFQPGTGNLYVVEDHANGDIFACLPDGADRDLQSDGCVQVLSVKDSGAEPTGFAFTADGKSAVLSIQHSGDDFMPLIDGYGTDDILTISGFQIP
ncbi:MAG TPA: alkaline phosphatase PhoX [Fibrobacteria bacterium]|nr:alkaline phosphatase PhoX [Fibrobacteria bacterium]